MVLIPCAAFADGTGSAETVSTITASEDTRIEVDQDANVIRFFIDGEETMRLDDSGLYVRDNLSYGGKILDDGASSFSGGSLGGVDAE